MRRILHGLALLIVGIIVLPLLAQDKPAEKKDPPELKKDDNTEPKKGDKSEPKKEEKKESPYKAAGSAAGKLLLFDEGKKTIKIRIEVPVLDQGEVNALQQSKLALARARNPQEAANAQRDIALHSAKLYKKEGKDVDLHCTDDVKVRMLTPPVRFNDKGDIVKPTKQELEEMKGPDKTLPGYTADFSDIRTDQLVQVALVLRKDFPPLGKDEKPTPEMIAERVKPLVSIILIADLPVPGGR